MKRIGVLSGVFDPIHKGHIGLALEAIKQAKLDEVYFLVETKPRHKTGVSHAVHRNAMIKIAIAPYPKLHLLELPDRQFTVAKTLPRLIHKFPGSELIYISGSDILGHMWQWPLIERMLGQMELVIAGRFDYGTYEVNSQIVKLPVQPKQLFIITSRLPDVSSRLIRIALSQGQKPNGSLSSLQAYIKKHWLYVSASASKSNSSS